MKKQNAKKLLRKEQERILSNMAYEDPASDEYETLLDRSQIISDLLKEENETFRKVGPTILGVAANLTGILMVMNYERFSIFTTKAFGLAFKPKI